MRSPFVPRFVPARLVAAALLAFVVSACATEGPPSRTFPELRFTHEPPLVLGAQGPEVESLFEPPLADPHVEHLMPLPPEQAIRTWVADRLKTTGVGENTVRVVIRDASVTETPLEMESGVRGFFTNDQEVRYDARAALTVQLLDPSGAMRAEATADAWRSRTIAERASLAEREQVWFELVEKLMQDLDTQLSAGIRHYFAPVLVRGG